MTRKTWQRRAGTVLAAAAAGVVFASGTSYADDRSVYTDDQNGYAYWTENGDTLEVCDLHSDGWGVRGYVYRPKSGDPGNGTVLIKASDPKYDGYASDFCVAVSVNVDENIRLSLKVCKYKGARIANCGYAAIPGRD